PGAAGIGSPGGGAGAGQGTRSPVRVVPGLRPRAAAGRRDRDTLLAAIRTEVATDPVRRAGGADAPVPGPGDATLPATAARHSARPGTIDANPDAANPCLAGRDTFGTGICSLIASIAGRHTDAGADREWEERGEGRKPADGPWVVVWWQFRSDVGFPSG